MAITPGIATLTELKAYLDKTNSADDVALQAMLDGVSQRVETYTGRRFRPDPPLADDETDTLAPVTRTVIVRRRRRTWGDQWDWPRQLVLDIPDAREIVSVVSANAAATLGSWQTLDDPPWRRLELFQFAYQFQNPVIALPSIELTGRFGLWPAPADLKDAVLMMAARRWKERDASYGDTVQFPEGMVVSYFRQFPPTVQATLEQYVRKVRIP